MAEIKKILFAFEIAEISGELATWAELIGGRFNAAVHLLHVIPELEYFHTPYAARPRRFDDEEELKRKTHALISKFCADKLKIPVKITVGVGRPVDVIMEYIKSEQISLVIVGTHGRTGLDRMIFGSITDRVLRLSPVPVLCIGPSQSSRPEGES